MITTAETECYLHLILICIFCDNNLVCDWITKYLCIYCCTLVIESPKWMQIPSVNSVIVGQHHSYRWDCTVSRLWGLTKRFQMGTPHFCRCCLCVYLCVCEILICMLSRNGLGNPTLPPNHPQYEAMRTLQMQLNVRECVMTLFFQPTVIQWTCQAEDTVRMETVALLAQVCKHLESSGKSEHP